MHILTLVLLLVCSPLHAGETWRVVGDEQFAPYSFVTMEDDTPHGVNVELIRAIMQAGAIDYQLRLYPWERVKRMLDRGEVDMAFQFAGTPERMAQYELVGPLRTGSTVFMTTNKIALQDWTSLDDFAPFVIGQVRGYAYQSDFDKADLARDTSAQNPRQRFGHQVQVLHPQTEALGLDHGIDEQPDRRPRQQGAGQAIHAVHHIVEPAAPGGPAFGGKLGDGVTVGFLVQFHPAGGVFAKDLGHIGGGVGDGLRGRAHAQKAVDHAHFAVLSRCWLAVRWYFGAMKASARVIQPPLPPARVVAYLRLAGRASAMA